MDRKKRLFECDDFPIFGTKDMIESHLRGLRRDTKKSWEAITNWDIPDEDIELWHSLLKRWQTMQTLIHCYYCEYDGIVLCWCYADAVLMVLCWWEWRCDLLCSITRSTTVHTLYTLYTYSPCTRHTAQANLKEIRKKCCDWLDNYRNLCDTVYT